MTDLTDARELRDALAEAKEFADSIAQTIADVKSDLAEAEDTMAGIRNMSIETLHNAKVARGEKSGH